MVTFQELSRKKKAELLNICEMYGIAHEKKIKKGELIDLILAFFWEDIADSQENEGDVPKSVRVKRIEELNK